MGGTTTTTGLNRRDGRNDAKNEPSSNGIRWVQELSQNRSRPGQVIIDSISVPAISEPARIGS